MDYIYKLDYDFVIDVCKELGFSRPYVQQRTEGWFLFYNERNQEEDYLLFCDFDVYGKEKDAFCKKAEDLWQVKMYQKFGNKYLRDLERYKAFKLDMDKKQKYAILKERVKNIKKGNEVIK